MFCLCGRVVVLDHTLQSTALHTHGSTVPVFGILLQLIQFNLKTVNMTSSAVAVNTP